MIKIGRNIICSYNAQMDLKLEIFVSIMDISKCSYQGAGNQSLMAQGAGQFIIQKLCADSLGIMVSDVLFLCIHVLLFQKVYVIHVAQSAYLALLYFTKIHVMNSFFTV